MYRYNRRAPVDSPRAAAAAAGTMRRARGQLAAALVLGFLWIAVSQPTEPLRGLPDTPGRQRICNVVGDSQSGGTCQVVVETGGKVPLAPETQTAFALGVFPTSPLGCGRTGNADDLPYSNVLPHAVLRIDSQDVLLMAAKLQPTETRTAVVATLNVPAWATQRGGRNMRQQLCACPIDWTLGDCAERREFSVDLGFLLFTATQTPEPSTVTSAGRDTREERRGPPCSENDVIAVCSDLLKRCQFFLNRCYVWNDRSLHPRATVDVYAVPAVDEPKGPEGPDGHASFTAQGTLSPEPSPVIKWRCTAQQPRGARFCIPKEPTAQGEHTLRPGLWYVYQTDITVRPEAFRIREATRFGLPAGTAETNPLGAIVVLPAHQWGRAMATAWQRVAATENRQLALIRRLLQEAEPAFPSINDVWSPDRKKPSFGGRCKSDSDCFKGAGKCEEQQCRGFFVSPDRDLRIPCVNGYACRIAPGKIPGIGIRPDFNVIGIHPEGVCGESLPLADKESIFWSKNRWACEAYNDESCVFTAGVGQFVNASAKREAIQLCGCAGKTVGEGNHASCSDPEAYQVSLGHIVLVECTTNKHCLDSTVSMCVENRCQQGPNVAIKAGSGLFMCLATQECNLQDVAHRVVQEGYKVLPLAATLNCGMKEALDPDYIKESALPCLVDVNRDGQCDVSLGVRGLLGMNRLCGCNGDKGGNGRDCDQPEDFTEYLGDLSVGECSIDSDCSETHTLCLDATCVEDYAEPVLVSSKPGNNSYVVPPVNNFTLSWNENIRFNSHRRAVVLQRLDGPPLRVPRIVIQRPATYSSAETGYWSNIKGRHMIVVPDTSLASLPEGRYRIDVEEGAVSDLAANPNLPGSIMFTVSKKAGCNFMFVTGFGVEPADVNGVYEAREMVNNHAAWMRRIPSGSSRHSSRMNGGGGPSVVYLRWRKPGSGSGWVIAPSLKKEHLIARVTSDAERAAGETAQVLPPSGRWSQWVEGGWADRLDVRIQCSSTMDVTPPRLLKVSPATGSRSLDPATLEIRLQFNEPVTFGMSGRATFTPIGEDKTPLTKGKVVLSTKMDEGFRGSNIVSEGDTIVLLRMKGALGLELLPGKTYELMLDPGFVTDLAGNPWSGLGSPRVYTTYGVPCKNLSPTEDGYVMVNGQGKDTAHGARHRVQCAKNFSAVPVTSLGATASDIDTENAEEDAPADVVSTTQHPPRSWDIVCEDGEWHNPTWQCVASCPHPDQEAELSGLYMIDATQTKTEEGRFSHGTVLDASCTDRAVLVSIESSDPSAITKEPGVARRKRSATAKIDESTVESDEALKTRSHAIPLTLTCERGIWRALKGRCARSCGSYPDLGPRYAVTVPVEPERDHTLPILGARRVISCVPPAIPSKGSKNSEEEVECQASGWNAKNLECHVPCQSPETLLKVGYVLHEGSTVHGAVRKVTCAQGYYGGLMPLVSTSFGANNSLVTNSKLSHFDLAENSGRMEETHLMCDEGYWVLQTENFSCFPLCKSLVSNSAYVYEPLTGVPQGQQGSHLRVTCAENAVRESAQSAEILSCQKDGTWSPQTVHCLKPCMTPEQYFKSSSYRIRADVAFVFLAEYFKDGTTVWLQCATARQRLAGFAPQHMRCRDGTWFIGEIAVFPGTIRSFLHCESPCGTVYRDKVRYLAVEVLESPSQFPLSTGQTSGATVIAGSRGIARCAPTFQAALSNRATETRGGLAVTCVDGRWRGVPRANASNGPPLDITTPGIAGTNQVQLGCFSGCSKASVLSELAQKGYQPADVIRQEGLQHGEALSVVCTTEFTPRLLGDDPSQGLLAWCFKGGLKLPETICAPPSCSDGVQNGNETGIDCGGPCVERPHCSFCRRFPQECKPSCQDGLQNGDEQGVDCGGKLCPSCAVCVGLPQALKRGMRWSIDRGRRYRSVLYERNEVANSADLLLHTAVGTTLDVRCDEGFEQVSLSPTQRFQSFVCLVGAGGPQWRLADGALEFVLRCEAPRCDDGRQNGGEWGVDCGGPCPNACPSCDDGVQNGDEEGRDCGGRWCPPCQRCRLALFREDPPWAENKQRPDAGGSLSLQVVEALDRRGRRVRIAHPMDSTAAVESGSMRHIRCLQNQKSVQLVCDNGSWFLKGTEKVLSTTLVVALECTGSGNGVTFQAARDGPSSLRNSLEHSPRAFGAPVFRLPLECGNEGVPQAPEEEYGGGSSCCDFLSWVNAFFSNECGALLYSSEHALVDAFCSGPCTKELEQKLTRFAQPEYMGSGSSSSLGGSSISEETNLNSCPKMATLIATLTGAFCVKASADDALVLTDPRRLSRTRHSGSGPTHYCFAYARGVMDQVAQFHTLRESVLESACHSGSCFRSNFNYFEALERLTGIGEATSSWLDKKRMGPSQFRPVEEVRHLMMQSRYSTALLSFACLKDAQGRLCATTVQELLGAGHSNIASAGGPAGGLSGHLSSETCIQNSCLWNVIRHAGQWLYNEGKTRLSPYHATLGVLMRAYGRAACQFSLDSQRSCGGLLSSQSIDEEDEAIKMTYAAADGGSLSVYSLRKNDPSEVSLSAHCECPKSRLGDDVCDPECFTPACGYDFGDCFVAKLFPGVYHRLTAQLPLDGHCHPFNEGFDCRDRLHKEGCYMRITGLLSSEGCCASVRWEVLREVLQLDVDLRQRAAAMEDLREGPPFNEVLSSAKGLVLNRSPQWVEATCGISLNSACSAGILRSKIRLRFRIEGLVYSPLFVDPAYAEVAAAVTQGIRQGLADLLAIPLYDVTEIRFWPWDVQTEVVIDPGVVFSELYPYVGSLKSNGQLAKQLRESVMESLWATLGTSERIQKVLKKSDTTSSSPNRWRQLQMVSSNTEDPAETGADLLPQLKVDILEVGTVQVKDFPLSLRESSGVLPPTGTLDMADLTGGLKAPACPASLSLNPFEKPDPNVSHGNANEVYVYVIEEQEGEEQRMASGRRTERFPPLSSPQELYQPSIPDGAYRYFRCAEGFAPSLRNSGPSPQRLQCDRGLWVPVSPLEERLSCRRVCPAFPSNGEIFLSSRGLVFVDKRELTETRDGATRTLGCAPGYTAAGSSTTMEATSGSQEVVTCKNGVWEKPSLICRKGSPNRLAGGEGSGFGFSGSTGSLRGDGISQPVCGERPLASLFDRPDVYALRVIPLAEDSPTTARKGTQAFASETGGSPAQLWGVQCARGYVPAPGSEVKVTTGQGSSTRSEISTGAAPGKIVRSMGLLCINGTWVASTQRDMGQRGDLQLPIEQNFGDVEMTEGIEVVDQQRLWKFQTDVLRLLHFQHQIKEEPWNSQPKDTEASMKMASNPPESVRLGDTLYVLQRFPVPFSKQGLLNCTADIKDLPWVSALQPGLSDTEFYVLIFGSCILCCAIGVCLFYCQRTRCMRKPFFDTNEESLKPATPDKRAPLTSGARQTTAEKAEPVNLLQGKTSQQYTGATTKKTGDSYSVGESDEPTEDVEELRTRTSSLMGSDETHHEYDFPRLGSSATHSLARSGATSSLHSATDTARRLRPSSPLEAVVFTPSRPLSGYLANGNNTSQRRSEAPTSASLQSRDKWGTPAGWESDAVFETRCDRRTASRDSGLSVTLSPESQKTLGNRHNISCSGRVDPRKSYSGNERDAKTVESWPSRIDTSVNTTYSNNNKHSTTRKPSKSGRDSDKWPTNLSLRRTPQSEGSIVGKPSPSENHLGLRTSYHDQPPHHHPCYPDQPSAEIYGVWTPCSGVASASEDYQSSKNESSFASPCRRQVYRPDNDRFSSTSSATNSLSPGERSVGPTNRAQGGNRRQDGNAQQYNHPDALYRNPAFFTTGSRIRRWD